MKLSVSFIRKDNMEHVSIMMDKPDGDYVARHDVGMYALHMVSLQVYEVVGNVICSRPIETTGLTVRVI